MDKAQARYDFGEKECIPIHMSFLQPWGDEYFPNLRLWRSEFLSHQRLGVDEVVLQWTMWGADLNKEITLPVWVEAAIMGADQAGAKIWFGLRYDPSLIENLKNKGQPYLDARLHETKQIATALKSQMSYAANPSEVFAGWYISDEIDAALLQDNKLRKLLTQYMLETQAILNRILPGPVSISGYTNSTHEPKKLARLWDTLLDNTLVDVLLLQDGLGAKLMEPYSSRKLQRAISAQFKQHGHTVIPVVEIFEIDPRKPDFRTMPTTVGTMKRRLDNARFDPNQPVALFSLSSHILKYDNKHSRDIEEFLSKNAKTCGRSIFRTAVTATQ